MCLFKTTPALRRDSRSSSEPRVSSFAITQPQWPSSGIFRLILLLLMSLVKYGTRSRRSLHSCTCACTVTLQAPSKSLGNMTGLSACLFVRSLRALIATNKSQHFVMTCIGIVAFWTQCVYISWRSNQAPLLESPRSAPLLSSTFRPVLATFHAHASN